MRFVPTLLAALLGLPAANVVLLSGDRDLGGLYREGSGPPHPLTEITSSSLDLPFWPAPAKQEPAPNRIGAVWGMENFGTGDIDWWAARPALRRVQGRGASAPL